jgi:hypothetical protein
MAVEFQNITDYAIDGHYARSPVFNQITELRLSILIMNRNEAFTIKLTKRVHTVDLALPEEMDDGEDKSTTPESIPR